MPTVTLRAHFDGKRILLDEPFDLQPNTSLLVTIMQFPVGEQEEWHNVSSQGLTYAYSEDEPEYSLNLVKEPNPDYEGG